MAFSFALKEERRPVNVYPVFFLKVNFIRNISSHKLSALSLTTRESLWSFAMPCAIIYSE